jgi:hypothetical protein
LDEESYKRTYRELNPNRCIFEKAITNQRCDCQLKRKFILASRECVACESEDAQTQCTSVLNSIRDNARFALKVVTIDGPMPHNKELQVQAGGMLALQNILSGQASESSQENETPRIVTNIHQTMQQALLEYQHIENLPYSEIVKSIVSYQSRPRRRKK